MVSAENGFVTLAVGEGTTFRADFCPKPGLVKRGEKYEICFRGVGVEWRRFGWVEELKAGGVEES